MPEEIEIEPWTEIEFKKFYKSVSGSLPLKERQSYYRMCLEKWLELKQQGIDISGLLSKKGIKNIAIFGVGSIGKLLVNELIEQNRIRYFIVTKKKSAHFMGYLVYGYDEELPVETDSLSLIVIPGYDMEEIKKLLGEKFENVYSLEEILN